MSEMLGNQLFLLQKYDECIPHLEAVADKYPDRLGPRRKLTFAYAFVGELEKSLSTLENLIRDDPQGIVGTMNDICKKLSDDCDEEMDTRELLRRSLLSLFCDPQSSLGWFRKVYVSEKNPRIGRILTWLESL